MSMPDPVIAVADSLQALRNGTTDEQWDGLKSNPLVRDLIGRCADLEAAMLLDDQTSAAELPVKFWQTPPAGQLSCCGSCQTLRG